VAVLVPFLKRPGAQSVHFVSSRVFSEFLPGVKYCPGGHHVFLRSQELAVLVPFLKRPGAQSVHFVSSRVFSEFLPVFTPGVKHCPGGHVVRLNVHFFSWFL